MKRCKLGCWHADKPHVWFVSLEIDRQDHEPITLTAFAKTPFGKAIETREFADVEQANHWIRRFRYA